MRTGYGTGFVLLFCWRCRVAYSFLYSRIPIHAALASRPHHTAFHQLNLSTEVDETATTSTSSLRFYGELAVNSEPGKLVDIENKIVEFFKIPAHRNLLVTGGGARKLEEINLTDDLLEQWKKAAAKVGCRIPTGGVDGETLLAVEAGGIQFPGLTVFSRNILGSKFLAPSRDSPTYEFVLIRDEQSIEGLPPIVWIFKQLTGYGNKDSKSESSASSLSRVTVDIDEARMEFTFKIVCNLEIYVKLPSLLLRVLPVSKEKAEEQGSAAVLKAVEGEASKGLNKFKEAYDTWSSA